MSKFNNLTEVWRKVRGFDSRYEVSNLGRIRSLSNGHYRVLSPSNGTNGYLSINLLRGSKYVPAAVHRLVARAFVKNSRHVNVVDHINGKRNDNRACNLRWVTQLENNRFLLHRQHDKRSSANKTNVMLWNRQQTHKFNSLSNAARWLQKHDQTAAKYGFKALESKVDYACINGSKSYTIFGFHCYKNQNLKTRRNTVSLRISKYFPRQKSRLVKTFLSTIDAARYLKHRLGLSSSLRIIASDLSFAYHHGTVYRGYQIQYLSKNYHDKMILRYFGKKLQDKYGENYVLLKRFKKNGRYQLKVKYIPKDLTFIVAQNEAFRKRRKSIIPQHHNHVLLIANQKGIKFRSASAAARYLHKLDSGTSVHALATEIRITLHHSNQHSVHGFEVRSY